MTPHITQWDNTLLSIQIKQEKELLSMLICGGENKQNHILNHICPNMFQDTLNREILEMCQDQFNKHGIKALNPDDLINDYQGKKYKNAVFEALLTLSNEYITAVNCDYYIKKVQENWIKRLAENSKSLEELREIEKLKTQYELKDELSSLAFNSEDLIVDYIDRWEKPIRTYYPSIDEKIGSLQGGDVLILCGATGMGKTCMLLNLVKRMAKHGKKILLFSLEMSLQQLQNRIISAEQGIDVSKIRNFTMTDDELKKYNDYAISESFKRLPIKVCTEYNININCIRSIVLESDCDIVCIDYLGLIGGDMKNGSYERISEISRQLKLLALETKKPFIILHQLNRASKDRGDKRPLLSDIRDSGKIEQDADFICFVFRPAYYSTNENPNKLEFIVAKSRHSQSGIMIPLIYNGNKQEIIDPKGEYKQEGKQCILNY